jgi:hypothetical protein
VPVRPAAIADADSPTARARALVRAGRRPEAERVIAELIRGSLGLAVISVAINDDIYSLNSLNGFVALDGGEEFFFKFHQEEGEGDTVAEYYNAEFLHAAGFPVDRPVHVSSQVGRQILLYRRRADPRFADVCRAAELAGDGADIAALVGAQEGLDRLIGERYLAVLHEAAADQMAAEPIHRLFHDRLVDPGHADRLGGRARRFYVDRRFDFPGVSLEWRELARLKWRINGLLYRDSLVELFEDSRVVLSPRALPTAAAVIAHGDAHNANLWFEQSPPRLVFFDPAFAGRHVPALLAEVKATFHNIFAHPFWLYDAAIAGGRFVARVAVRGDAIEVEHDWRLSPLRAAFLESKGRHVWRPLLAELRRRGLLPAEWRRYLRLALFCCPTLVMDLRAGGAGGHNPITSAIGLATAVMAGSEPVGGGDIVAGFLDAIAPA